MAKDNKSKRISLDNMPSSQLVRQLMQAQAYRPPVTQLGAVNDVGSGISGGANAIISAIQQNRSQKNMMEMVAQQAQAEQAMLQQQAQAEQMAAQQQAQNASMAFMGAGAPNNMANALANSGLDASTINALIAQSNANQIGAEQYNAYRTANPGATSAQTIIALSGSGRDIASNRFAQGTTTPYVLQNLGNTDLNSTTGQFGANILTGLKPGTDYTPGYQQAQINSQTIQNLSGANLNNANTNKVNTLTPFEANQIAANTNLTNQNATGQALTNTYIPGLSEGKITNQNLVNTGLQNQNDAFRGVSSVLGDSTASPLAQQNAAAVYQLLQSGNSQPFMNNNAAQFGGTDKQTGAYRNLEQFAKPPIQPQQPQQPWILDMQNLIPKNMGYSGLGPQNSGLLYNNLGF